MFGPESGLSSPPGRKEMIDRMVLTLILLGAALAILARLVWWVSNRPSEE